MNELLIKIEKLYDSELSYLFEYLVELMNIRKEEKRLKAKLSKAKENLTTNSLQNSMSAQNVENYIKKEEITDLNSTK